MENLVSIITPYYYGGTYMNGLLETVEKNALKCKEINAGIELIIVNDSPEEKVELPAGDYEFQIRIINNEKNVGIHKSRSQGVLHALGKYVLFLDQDDVLSEYAVFTHLKRISQSDVSVGNGYIQKNGKFLNIFKNSYVHKLACELKPILYYNTLIMSPGQCLIKKESIPYHWMNYSMTINGADDELLWILLLKAGSRFCVNSEYTYYHMETGKNLSDNHAAMCQSGVQGIEDLHLNEVLTEREIYIYTTRKNMKIERYKKSIVHRIFGYFKSIPITLYCMWIYFVKLL